MMRPAIFLYTEQAEVSDEVKAAMITAGYLPVKVADVDSVRILASPLSIDGSELNAITKAALETIGGSQDVTERIASRFGFALSRALTTKKS